MAFNGLFLKVGNFEITGKHMIQAESYTVTRSVQDLDSYRDANGVLHRNALNNVPIKITFDLLPGRTNAQMNEFFGNIRRNFKIPIERKASVTCYVPEIDDYVTQDMYMPDLEFKIDRIEGNVIYYKSMTVKFIGY